MMPQPIRQARTWSEILTPCLQEVTLLNLINQAVAAHGTQGAGLDQSFKRAIVLLTNGPVIIQLVHVNLHLNQKI